MADQDEQLSRELKRGDDHDGAEQTDEPQAKQPRNTATVNDKPQTKITDVNNDCLEHIFGHLELNDLLNISNANKQLKAATETIFLRKYGGKSVKFSTGFLKKEDYIKVEPERISIYNLTTYLRFIRCFGHLVSRLEVSYVGQNLIYFAEIESYVLEHCQQTLRGISFLDVEVHSFTTIDKPFSAVQSVSVNNGKLGKHLSQFNNWFPNMQRLRFGYNVQVEDQMCIEKHFPHLKCLTIENNWNPLIGLSGMHIAEAMRLNPNLKSLCLYLFDTKLLEHASKYLRRLEILEIFYRKIAPNHAPIHFDSVKRLSITQMNGYTYEYNDFLVDSNISFRNVEEFTNVFYQIVSTQPFFSSNPLKKVCLHSGIQGDKIHLARSLPLVTELIFKCFKLTVDDVMNFLNECPMLTKFHFEFNDLEDYRNLIGKLKETRFEPEWRTSVENENILKNRIKLQR